MAKRRVGNPLFETQQPEQFVNLQEPSFLEGFNDQIPEVEGIEGTNGQLPPEMSQEMPQSLDVQDARQIPLPEKEPSFLDSIGQYFTTGLSNFKDYVENRKPDDLMPQDYAGLENLAPPEEQQQVEPGQDMYTQGYKRLAEQMYGGKYENPVKPGEDMYTQANKAYTDKMSNLPPYEPDLSEEGMNFARAMGGELPKKEEDIDAMEGLSAFAEGESELAKADAEPQVEDPEFVEKIISGQPPIKNEVSEEEVYQRAETEGTPVAGAVEAAENNPYVMDELARQNKIEKVPPELMQYAKEWQDAYTKRKEELSQREEALLKKLETGELSDYDKLGIALAIAIPVVMGLMYGGTAFALSTAGVLQSIGGMKNQEFKDQSKAREGLGELTKEKLKLSEEGIKMRQDIIDKLPNKEVRKFLENKNFEKFGDDIGISAEDEKGALWINKNKIKDDEDVKKMRERTKEAEELIGGVSNFNEALDGVQEIISVLKDQDPGLMDILRKNYKFLETTSPDQIANSSLGDILSLISKAPGLRGKAIDMEVVGKDGKITKVNGLDALQQSIKALQNDYNTAVLKGSRLTENVMKHWSGIMFDPTSITQFLSSGIEGWAENTNNLRNIMNRKIQEELVGYGFLRQPLQEVFPVNERNILRPVSAVNRDISKNPDAYKNKVR